MKKLINTIKTVTNKIKSNPLKPKFMCCIYIYIRVQSVLQRDTTLYHYKAQLVDAFKEIIVVYSENHSKSIQTKYSVTDC
jgi:hypothetical protein